MPSPTWPRAIWPLAIACFTASLTALSFGCEEPVELGGGGAGAGPSGGSPSTGGTGAEGGIGGVPTGGGGEGGGAVECKPLTLGKVHSFGPTYYEVDIVENVDGPEPDVLSMSFWASPTVSTWSGVQDLASVENSNFSTCTTCINVYADDGVYFQAAGALDLGSAVLDDDSPDLRGYIPDGSISLAKFVEVYVDIPTRVSTPVPGGDCYTIDFADLKMPEPPAEWTCEPGIWDDDYECSCNCGVVDEDCSDPSLDVGNCDEGQTCNPDLAICAGTPPDWTCAPSLYGNGAACDCLCGTYDSDCAIVPAVPIAGCNPDEVCNPKGECVPSAWTCSLSYYGDDSCDCGCGVLDIDCADATSASCQYCSDAGSCDTVDCGDAASIIDPASNWMCQ